MTKLYMAIPCYNEQEVLPETSKRLHEKFTALIDAGKISPDSRVVFINDGSKDRTWELICQLHGQDSLFSGIDLSRNRGHQNALLAGLMTLKDEADAIISMDAGLQDDINAIDQMVEKFEAGCDIVYGVRSNRETDSAFKRMTAEGFYKLMRALGADTVYNHADYRLMSRRALQALAGYQEVNLFLRGMVPMIGYRSDIVYYARGERFAGESKYPLKKMLAFAFEGITSLSDRPLKLITSLGCTISVITVLVMLALAIFAPPIGASVWLGISLWLLGGLQLIALGIVGRYVGKIYLETKRRPRYLVREYLHDGASQNEKA